MQDGSENEGHRSDDVTMHDALEAAPYTPEGLQRDNDLKSSPQDPPYANFSTYQHPQPVNAADNAMPPDYRLSWVCIFCDGIHESIDSIWEHALSIHQDIIPPDDDTSIFRPWHQMENR